MRQHGRGDERSHTLTQAEPTGFETQTLRYDLDHPSQQQIVKGLGKIVTRCVAATYQTG